MVQDGWIVLRAQGTISNGSFDLLSEPLLSRFKDDTETEELTFYPQLYFSHNARTRQTTIVTTDLDQLHLRMGQHLEALPEIVNSSECPTQIVQLLIQYFAALREIFEVTAARWDFEAGGEVCCGQPRFTLRLMRLSLLPTGNGVTNFGHE